LRQYEHSGQAEDAGDDDGIRAVHKEDAAGDVVEVEQVVPWAELCALIQPYIPSRAMGRRPKKLEHMLRIHFLRQCAGRQVEPSRTPCARKALTEMAERGVTGCLRNHNASWQKAQ
jgi:hypothetical protein